MCKNTEIVTQIIFNYYLPPIPKIILEKFKLKWGKNPFKFYGIASHNWSQLAESEDTFTCQIAPQPT